MMLGVVSSPKCRKDHLENPTGNKTLCGVPCFNNHIRWFEKNEGTTITDLCLCCLTIANDEGYSFKKKEELF